MARRRGVRKLAKWIPFLQVLSRLTPDVRVIVLAHLNDEARDQIYQAVNHVLHDTSLSKTRRRYLRSRLIPHQDQLRHLADRAASKRSKRKVLLQVGGAPLAPVLKSAVPLLLRIYSVGKY